MQTIDEKTTTAPLTADEQQTLAACERVIDTGLTAYYETGRALRMICDGKLYRTEFTTFEDYCRDRWGFTKTHAYRLIKAADLVNSMTSSDQSVTLPSSESVARPLTMIDRRLIKKVWTMAMELSAKPTAKDVKEAIRIARQEHPRMLRDAYREIMRDVREANRQKRIEIARSRADTTGELAGVGRHSIILADVPWRYDFGLSSSAAPELHYPTMTTDEIRALPVESLAADDAVLFFWTPSSKLREAFGVLDAWGFTYKSGAVWDKCTPKMGHYVRLQHEHLLIATRGNLPAPATESRPSSVIREQRAVHSAKPTAVYEIIETMYPTLSKLEMFARGVVRPGWTAWGNEVIRSDAA